MNTQHSIPLNVRGASDFLHAMKMIAAQRPSVFRRAFLPSMLRNSVETLRYSDSANACAIDVALPVILGVGRRNKPTQNGYLDRLVQLANVGHLSNALTIGDVV